MLVCMCAALLQAPHAVLQEKRYPMLTNSTKEDATYNANSRQGAVGKVVCRRAQEEAHCSVHFLQIPTQFTHNAAKNDEQLDAQTSNVCLILLHHGCVDEAATKQ